MRIRRVVLLLAGAFACGGSIPKPMPGTDSTGVVQVKPISPISSVGCSSTETVAPGDSVVVTDSEKDKKLRVVKKQPGDTAHQPRLLNCITIYTTRDTAHQP